jgi:hypothetical protein
MLSNTLVASAMFTLERPMTVSAAPETFVPRQCKRFETEVPSYRKWNTTAYLSKAERELNLIFFVRHEPNDPKHKLHIKWWLNHGAVGGGDSVTMPFDGYLRTLDWYSHPWAIAHEMLHTFGVGHSHEMDRLDRAVQEYMEYQRWYAADHPEYISE